MKSTVDITSSLAAKAKHSMSADEDSKIIEARQKAEEETKREAKQKAVEEFGKDLMFEKKDEKVAKTKMLDAEIGDCALVQSTFTSANGKTVPTIIMYFKRPKVEDKQGYSEIGVAQYVYNEKRKEWIATEHIDEYVQKGEVDFYKKSQLKDFVEKFLPAQKLKVLLLPSDDIVRLLTPQEKVQQLFEQINPTLMCAKPARFGSSPQVRAANEIRSEFQALKSSATLEKFDDAIQKFVTNTLRIIGRLPHNDHFAIEIENTLRESYPAQVEKAAKEILAKPTASINRPHN